MKKSEIIKEIKKHLKEYSDKKVLPSVARLKIGKLLFEAQNQKDNMKSIFEAIGKSRSTCVGMIKYFKENNKQIKTTKTGNKLPKKEENQAKSEQKKKFSIYTDNELYKAIAIKAIQNDTTVSKLIIKVMSDYVGYKRGQN